MGGYQLLSVGSLDGGLKAVLDRQQLLGQRYRDQLQSDFQLLCQLGSESIELDLRSLEFMDGRFPGLLVELATTLQAQGRRLTVVAAPGVADVLRVTKLNQLFEVVVAH